MSDVECNSDMIEHGDGRDDEFVCATYGDQCTALPVLEQHRGGLISCEDIDPPCMDCQIID